MLHSGDSGEGFKVSEPDLAAEKSADSPRELPARRGFSISYRGKTLLSRIDPVSQAERLAAEISVKPETLYFCPSPLYAYGFSRFLKRLRSESPQNNSAILCVEADDKLLEISQKEFLRFSRDDVFHDNDFPRLALAKAYSPQQICGFVRETWGVRQFRRVELVRFTGGWQLFPGLYEDIEIALRREIAVEWSNAMTLIHLGRLYARNLIRNLPLIPAAKKIETLDFGFSPILVLGAGPSLDSALDELSSLCGGKIPACGERQYKIVCADSCLPALHERGILPDLVLILESQHWNLRAFSGARGRKINSVLDLSALPASARVLAGDNFFFATAWTELKLFKRLKEAGLLPETFPPLGSVGLSAVALALRISSGPVISAGMDFSFTLDAYHARSTPGHNEQLRKQNRFRSIINARAAFKEGSFALLSKNGKPVRSEPSMRNYRQLFEQEFGGNDRLFDINGTGLPLGTKTVSPAEAFALLNGAAQSAKSTDSSAVKIFINNASGNLGRFIRREIDVLIELREMLSGIRPPQIERLEELLDISDYLWAHFPDYAGSSRRPSAADLSFLKRVRTEIDPFLKLWEFSPHK